MPFLYASSAAVYGGGTVFREERAYEAPLNVYGYSKFLFDQLRAAHAARAHGADRGLSLFQRLRPARAAQGPHGVGRAATSSTSTARDGPRAGCSRARAATPTASSGAISSHVDDVVAVESRVPRPSASARGIFNLGTGRAATFNDGRAATINACRGARGEPPRSLAELVGDGAIEYMPIPAGARRQVPELHPGRPRRGFAPPATTRRCWRSSEGVARYVESLISGDRVSSVSWALDRMPTRHRRGARRRVHLTFEGDAMLRLSASRSRSRCASQLAAAARQPQHRHQGRARRAARHRSRQGAGDPRLSQRSTAASSRSRS